MSKLKIISKPKQLDQLIHYCKQTKYCSFDFETTSFSYYDQEEFPTILGVSFQIGSAWILPLKHFESPFLKKDRWEKYLKKFGREVLEDPEIVKVAWNLKFEYKWCKRFGIELRGRLFDGMLAKYLLDEERSHDLKDVVRRIFPNYGGYEEKIDKRIKWKDKPMETLAPYCGIDCDLTLRAMMYFEPRLIQRGFYNLFRNLLMMATRVLGDSEYEGILIDKEYLDTLCVKYDRLIRESEAKLYKHKTILKFERKHKQNHILKLIEGLQLEIAELRAGDKATKESLIAARQTKINRILRGELVTKKEKYNGINFNSPIQMADLLFTKHGFGFKVYKETESGKPSTDEETLEHFKPRDKSGFLSQLLEHRGLTKLNSTYIQGLVPLLDKYNRVHAGFKLHGTVTGRLSCAEPNLQQIPRGTTSSDIKKMYIAPLGYVLLEVDYSQAELRVVAELAQDKVMIDIFKRNYNIHVATACLINGGLDLYDKVKGILKDEKHPDWLFWEKQKKRAKLVNFGILYGQTEKKLSIELECSEQEASEFIEMWFDNYPQVAKWIKRQKKFAHKHGYVMSMWGRKRRLYNIYSDKFGVMLEAERQSVNCPIQSAASDYTLFSQVIIWEKIREGELPQMQQAYTVHDSIGYYVKATDIHKVVPEIIKICANPDTMKYFGFEMKDVNMKVAVEVGPNWFDKHDYDPWKDYTKMAA